VRSFTSRGDPERILQAISEEFGVRIEHEDEYWQHEPTEECLDAWDAMAEKADQEFLSFPKIISARSDDAIRTELAWQ
jgi:hypothetical protein